MMMIMVVILVKIRGLPCWRWWWWWCDDGDDGGDDGDDGGGDDGGDNDEIVIMIHIILFKGIPTETALRC